MFLLRPAGKWSAAVVLRRKNPKGKSGETESVYMRPPSGADSPIAVEKDSAMEAKHYAAVFAMFRFSHNLRLNMQLPPQPRDYWAALEKEKASSPPNKAWLWSLTPFETAAAAPQNQPPLPGPPPSEPHPRDASPFASTASSSRAPASATLVKPGVRAAPTPRAPPIAATLPKYWLEAPEVRMPTHLRDLVEETIRASMSAVPHLSDEHTYRSLDDFTDPDSFAAQALSTLTAAEQACVDALINDEGFRRGQVLSALSYVTHARRQGADSVKNPTTDVLQRSLATMPLRNALLSHLHLHVPEEDLSAHLRGAKPADATARIATSNGVDALGRLWKAERIAKDAGVPVAVCEAALAEERVRGEEGRAIELLGRRLVGWFDHETEDRLDEDQVDPALREGALLDSEAWNDALDEQERQALADRREDELVGLEGMFGERFRRVGGGCEILVSAMKAGRGDQVILRVLFHEGSRYPSPTVENDDPKATLHLPTFYVYSSTLPPYLRLHLTQLLHQQFVSPTHSEDWLDLVRAGYGGVVGELATFLSEHWSEQVDHPPDARKVLRWLMGSRLRPSSSTPGSGTSTPKKVPNGKSLHSRRGPSKTNGTTAQHAAVSEYWRAVAERAGYDEMLAIRMRLPAWPMRERIVDLIGRNRVVIVSGETGSGKTTQGGFDLNMNPESLHMHELTGLCAQCLALCWKMPSRADWAPPPISSSPSHVECRLSASRLGWEPRC